jgi:Na+-translocating ferredoxin:NAD+ oxidoreductase RnfD subunit
MWRFFRTPKGVLTIILGILLAVAVPAGGGRTALPGLITAVAAAMALDLIILRMRGGRWEFPSGALLTALIVVMVLSPQEPWHVAAITAVIAVASKYVFRVRTANVFNPAALGLVVTFYVFDTGQSWWGALPDFAPWGLVLLVGTGLFMTHRVNKVPMVLAFLGAYFLLFTVTAFVSDPAKLAEIFRAPDLQASLYFAFFILTDPPTSPTKYRHQVICAVLVACVGYAVFEWTGAAHYLLSGVLAGNVWEAVRRRR